MVAPRRVTGFLSDSGEVQTKFKPEWFECVLVNEPTYIPDGLLPKVVSVVVFNDGMRPFILLANNAAGPIATINFDTGKVAASSNLLSVIFKMQRDCFRQLLV